MKMPRFYLETTVQGMLLGKAVLPEAERTGRTAVRGYWRVYFTHPTEREKDEIRALAAMLEEEGLLVGEPSPARW